MERVSTALRRPGYRYLIVGGSVYLFELAVIVLAQALGASPDWSVTISFCLGTALSFFIQKLVTFKDKRMQRHVLVPQLIATGLLIGWNLVFSVLLTNLLHNHAPAVVARTLAIGICTIWNFYVYKIRIFAATEQSVIA